MASGPGGGSKGLCTAAGGGFGGLIRSETLRATPLSLSIWCCWWSIFHWQGAKPSESFVLAPNCKSFPSKPISSGHCAPARESQQRGNLQSLGCLQASLQPAAPASRPIDTVGLNSTPELDKSCNEAPRMTEKLQGAPQLQLLERSVADGFYCLPH